MNLDTVLRIGMRENCAISTLVGKYKILLIFHLVIGRLRIPGQITNLNVQCHQNLCIQYNLEQGSPTRCMCAPWSSPCFFLEGTVIVAYMDAHMITLGGGAIKIILSPPHDCF